MSEALLIHSAMKATRTPAATASSAAVDDTVSSRSLRSISAAMGVWSIRRFGGSEREAAHDTGENSILWNVSSRGR